MPFGSAPGQAHVLHLQQIIYPTHIRQVAKKSTFGVLFASILATFWAPFGDFFRDFNIDCNPGDHLGAQGGPRGSRGTPGRENDTKIDSTTKKNDVHSVLFFTPFW